MKPAVINGICRFRGHCTTCRTDPAWRAQTGTPEICPHGITLTGLGSFIEALAKPIAKLLRLPCLDPRGNLRPQSGCAKRRDALNRITK